MKRLKSNATYLGAESARRKSPRNPDTDQAFQRFVELNNVTKTANVSMYNIVKKCWLEGFDNALKNNVKITHKKAI